MCSPTAFRQGRHQGLDAARLNQFRLLLASLAYTLIVAIRRLGLADTDMARAQCATIRLKLLKIAAVITRNTRRVRFHLSSACPEQDLFRLVAARLKPGYNPAPRPGRATRPRSRNRQPWRAPATGENRPTATTGHRTPAHKTANPNTTAKKTRQTRKSSKRTAT